MMKGKTYTIYGNSKEMQKESKNGKVHHTPPDVSPYVWPSPDGLLEDVRVVPPQTQQSSAESLHSPPSHELQYRIEDNPPWHLCIILGFQHYLTMFGATIAIPLIVAPALCIGDDSVAKSEILGTLLFVSGLVTIIQTTVGIRLPIIQGGTFSFLVPTFAILSLPQWKCPDPPEGHNETINGSIVYVEGGFTEDEHKEIWQSRMREIQGAIIVSALFQVVIGFSGIIGIILRFIGPLSIAPTIALIGLSLFGAASDFSSKQWGIAFLTMFLITLFSQYLRNIEIPCLGYNKRKLGVIKYPLFKSFPVILGIVVTWIFCAILTETGAIENDPNAVGYGARTDLKIDVLDKASWIRFPYPGQWGMPTVSTAGVFGMLAGVLAAMLESIGDYYACARLAGAPPPPTHALNRGIMIEGIGCVLAGLWGTGTGTTSYSENIGAIGITKVGSRRVVQMGGALIILLGMLGKFGALFVTIPDPIIGGVFMTMFGMIAAVGVSNLQYVNLNSSRNLFIFGFSLFFGLSFPSWMSANSSVISTGSDIMDQIITVLLSTSMFVGGTVGFILDNTIPGTDKERGILAWKKQLETLNGEEAEQTNSMTYDIPLVTKYIRKVACFRLIPVCPTFAGCRKVKETDNDVELHVTAGSGSEANEGVRKREHDS